MIAGKLLFNAYYVPNPQMANDPIEAPKVRKTMIRVLSVWKAMSIIKVVCARNAAQLKYLLV